MKDWKRLRVPRLPKEYQEVEYLETHVQGYIDSGYAFAEPELKVEFKYMKLESLNNNLFGVDTSTILGPGSPSGCADFRNERPCGTDSEHHQRERFHPA